MQPQQDSQTPQDQRVLEAWREGIHQQSKHLPLKKALLAAHAPELLPRFSAHYRNLKALSRPMRRRLQRQWKRSLAGIALLMALGAQPALAATIPVRGDCNLIAAIRAANTDTARGGCPAGNGADTIVLPSNSTQTLTRAINTEFGPTGLPTILSTITIDGNGSTIRRARSVPRFRILNVAGDIIEPGVGDLTLLDTTVSGGRTNGGGGVVVDRFGVLTLRNATISGNSASCCGGGIQGFGGGRFILINSTISGNSAGDNGGGIVGGTAELINSTLSGNSAPNGGGTYSTRVIATNSTISDNSGGGVKAARTDAQFTDSIISGNTEFGLSGFRGNLDVRSSTISDNDGDGLITYGGFEYRGEGNVSVTNSTISGNNGRGIHVVVTRYDTSALEVTHSTVTGNARGGVFGNSGEGHCTDITLNRALISGNGEREVTATGECISVTANNFNVFGFSGNARVRGFSPGPRDIVPNRRLNAILDPDLADNGGPTETHALPAGSPAIDTVFDTCPPPDVDQRGVERPKDGDRDGGAVCDTGSFERRPGEG